MASINQHVSELADLALASDSNRITGSSDIILSTMTLDGKITNVKFDKITAIEHLELTSNIVEIGCNYGYKILEEYKKWPCYKDRMSKKTKRVAQNSSRKQGLGTHFNSQITFTVVSEKDALNSYQVKLFTNGRLQIPGIGKLSKRDDELLEDILSIIASYIASHPTSLMLNKENPVDLEYLTPILQNYKSLTLRADDCMLETIFVNEDNKRFQMIPYIDLAAFERVILAFKTHNRTPFPICSITFNPERYSGMLIKFSTPQQITGRFNLDKFIEISKLAYRKFVKKTRPAKPASVPEDHSHDSCNCEGECIPDCFKIRKMMRVARMMQSYWHTNSKSTKRFRMKITTVKMFRSGRINLDHVNDHGQAKMIRRFIVEQIMANWRDIVYYED